MTPPLTPRPDCPLEPTAAAKTTSTQLFGVLYITLTGLVDSVVPNSGPWYLLGRSWVLPAGLAAPHPEPPNASTYDWLPDRPLPPPIQELTLPEITSPSIEEEIANVSVMNNISILVLKTQELNPSPQKANQTPRPVQDPPIR
ncbi:hypothetical protein DSO57_1038743 [Entomophthora muscae]|uniref:Uncharacterized protein n=1 Tax=Entomophthora muscae TaxID=34485 RepID=A0ACC2RDB3_9FUNG|nr:hypothetical protein DSO57_1038743 [Entomophthora muscae]